MLTELSGNSRRQDQLMHGACVCLRRSTLTMVDKVASNILQVLPFPQISSPSVFGLEDQVNVLQDLVAPKQKPATTTPQVTC